MDIKSYKLKEDNSKSKEDQIKKEGKPLGYSGLCSHYATLIPGTITIGYDSEGYPIKR